MTTIVSSPLAIEQAASVLERQRTPESAVARPPRTNFERFELKYWVTEPLAQKILDFARPYLMADRYCLDRESQRNTSLYLDTRGFRCCEEHVNLLPQRFKLRIRAYGRPFGKTAFFEVKRKIKTMTVKDRCPVPIELVPNVLERRPLSVSLKEEDQRVLDGFVCQMSLARATPKLYTSCFREAFESRIPGEDVRLTIDREIVYQAATGSVFAPDERRWLAISDGGDSRPAFGRRRALLELKFDGALPRWMAELVRCFDLQREAFSKYVSAAQQLRARL